MDYFQSILTGQFKAALFIVDHCIRACLREHWEGKLTNGTFRWGAYHPLCWADPYPSVGDMDAFVRRECHHRGGDDLAEAGFPPARKTGPHVASGPTRLPREITHLAVVVGSGPLDTTITWRLEPEDSGTRLYLEHSRYNLDSPLEKMTSEGMGRGWPSVLKGIAPAIDSMDHM